MVTIEAPVKAPAKAPEEVPIRRLSPDEMCPAQKDDVRRRTEPLLP